MDLDQAFFLGIALVGALFLLLSFILGGLGDFFDSVGDFLGEQLPDIDLGGDADAGGAETAMDGADDGPSPLSLRSLMAFMTAYGASGLITSSYGWSTLASSLFAIIPGLAVAFIAYQMMRVLYSQQASSVVEVSSLAGRTGFVDVPIPPAGVGRVTVNTEDGQHSFIARSNAGTMIPTGARIVVNGNLGSELLVSQAPDTA